MIGKLLVTVRAGNSNCGIWRNNVAQRKILVDDWIKWLPPVLFRVVHHQVDKDGE